MHVEVKNSQLLADGLMVAEGEAVTTAEAFYLMRELLLKRLIARAAWEIRSHNENYHHRTPEAFLRELELAARAT